MKGYGDISHTRITYDGATHTLRDWAKVLGIPYATLRMRYSRGHHAPEVLFRTTRINGLNPEASAIKTVKPTSPVGSWSIIDELFSPHAAKMLRKAAEENNMPVVLLLGEMIERWAAKQTPKEDS